MTVAGNVGIGTVSPSSALDVVSTSSTGNAPFVTIENTSGATPNTFGPGVILLNHVVGQHGYILEQQQDSSGNFLISNSSSPFTPYISVNQSGSVGIGTISADNLLSVNGSADKPGGGSWGTFSDARLKDITAQYDLGLDAIVKLNPIIYRYKKDNARHLPSEDEYVGLVAQDVQPLIPRAVTTLKDGYLELNNDPIIFAMVNAIKDLKAVNDTEATEIKALRADIEQLKAASR